MRIHAVINERAAGALTIDPGKLVDRLAAYLTVRGHNVEVALSHTSSIQKAFASAAAAKPDVLIAGGGDGTVRCAAEHTIRTETALSILPLGTVNRLARELGIPLDPEAAIQSLASSEFQQIDVAEVNGRIFLCNSFLGLPPSIGQQRQNLRGAALSKRVLGYSQVLRAIAYARKRIEVTVGDEIASRRMRVMTLAVSNNLYGDEPSLFPKRARLDGGVLGVYAAKHRSGAGMMLLLLRAGLGLWRGDPNFDSFSASKVTINTKRHKVALSNDGEVEELRTPLYYSIRPRALKMFAPPAGSS